MTVGRNKAWAYAEDLISIPRRQVRVTLRSGKTGLVLLHKGRVLTRCYTSTVGKATGQFLAQALGVRQPTLGRSVSTEVSTGVLFRALSIASLNLRKPATHAILKRMLEEAEIQRAPTGEMFG